MHQHARVERHADHRGDGVDVNLPQPHLDDVVPRDRRAVLPVRAVEALVQEARRAHEHETREGNGLDADVIVVQEHRRERRDGGPREDAAAALESAVLHLKQRGEEEHPGEVRERDGVERSSLEPANARG